MKLRDLIRHGAVLAAEKTIAARKTKKKRITSNAFKNVARAARRTRKVIVGRG